MGVNDDFAQSEAAHGIGILRRGSRINRDAMAFLEAMERRLVERLSRVDLTTFNQDRTERLLRQVRKIMDGAYGDMTQAVLDDLRSLAAYEGEFQQGLFQRIVPIDVSLTLPSEAQLWAAVRTGSANCPRRSSGHCAT